jgi:hypothetical protein
LARIEAEGIDRFFGPLDAAKSPSVAAMWRDLSVIGGRVFPWHQPGIGIALPMTGGAVGVSRVVAAMDELASMSDNVEKLAVGGATERHFAIYVDHTATTVLTALRDLEAPVEAPDLPDEITDVWIFSETYGPDQYVVCPARVRCERSRTRDCDVRCLSRWLGERLSALTGGRSMLSACPTRGCLSGGMNVRTLHVPLIAVLVLTGIRAGAQTPQPGQPQLTPAEAKQKAADWAAADIRIITPSGVVNASGLPDLSAAYTSVDWQASGYSRG